MHILLDTHTFLWFINGDERLSKRSRVLIQDTDNLAVISIATLWEIAIKTTLGKFQLSLPFEVLIPQELADNDFTLLPIKLEHLVQLRSFPLHHRDPFDRRLIAQSLWEKMPLKR